MLQHKIAYMFSPDHNFPIDVRYKIPSLSAQIEISKRYVGMIFFAEDTGILYIYKDSITEPIPFSDYIGSSTIAGLYVSDYSYILDELNAIGTKTLGSLITVFPLGVTFVYNGVDWLYHSGRYNVTTEAQFNSIPKSLVADKKRVFITTTNENFITLANGDLSEMILQLPANIADVIDERYYEYRGNLYYYIEGRLFNIGKQEILITGYNFIDGVNTINHGMDSTTLSIRMITEDAVTIIDEYTPISDSAVAIEAYGNYTADLLIQTI